VTAKQRGEKTSTYFTGGTLKLVSMLMLKYGVDVEGHDVDVDEG
jgi:hypothetical protein